MVGQLDDRRGHRHFKGSSRSAVIDREADMADEYNLDIRGRKAGSRVKIGRGGRHASRLPNNEKQPKRVMSDLGAAQGTTSEARAILFQYEAYAWLIDAEFVARGCGAKDRPDKRDDDDGVARKGG